MNPVSERCPRCGKTCVMESGESLAYCRSCKSLHEPGERGNVDVEIAKFSIVAEGERVYVPFWRYFCSFKVSGNVEHKNIINFLTDENSGRMFVYVPSADIGPKNALELGAYMTAMSPSYSTAVSFGDVKRLLCTKLSSTARREVEYYFLAAETAEGRVADLRDGFSVEPSTEKLVYIPCYRSGDAFRPAV